MNFVSKVMNHLWWRAKYTTKITVPQLFLSFFLPKKVMTGPFAGMKYIHTSVGSVILPKLAGTYEEELNGILKETTHKGYKRFIDIGAAEGYYAVGVKKFLLPDVKQVICFEATAKGRRLIKELADANNITDILIKGFCTAEALSAVMSTEKTFLIVDIEGGEYELLNPDRIDFSNSDLLIEIHYVDGKTKEEELIQKFAKTHKAVIVQQQEKKLPEAVNWHPLIKKYRRYVVDEFRSDSPWLFLESKASGIS